MKEWVSKWWKGPSVSWFHSRSGQLKKRGDCCQLFNLLLSAQLVTFFFFRYVTKQIRSPQKSALAYFTCVQQLPRSVHFAAPGLVRRGSSLQATITLLTTLIRVAFALDVVPVCFASVTLLGQDLCARSLQTPRLAHGSPVCGTGHRADWWNELFKPAVKHSRLLGVSNICAGRHLQKYIICERSPPINSSPFSSNSGVSSRCWVTEIWTDTTFSLP